MEKTMEILFVNIGDQDADQALNRVCAFALLRGETISTTPDAKQLVICAHRGEAVKTALLLDGFDAEDITICASRGGNT
jgi:hypothetical protein